MRSLVKLIALTLLTVTVTQGLARAGQTFSTWNVFEADKCASIWLIQRFVDKGAKIKFYPKGADITEGVPFDVPEAKLRRYHNLSTYECVMRHYRLNDPVLKHIGRIIHDIEVNVWEKKALKESSSVDQAVKTIISESNSPEKTVRLTREYFDRLYTRIQTNLIPSK